MQKSKALADLSILNNLGLKVPRTKRKRYKIVEWERYDRWDTFFYRDDFVDIEKQLSAINSLSLDAIYHFKSRSWKGTQFENDEFDYVEISGVDKELGIFRSRKVSVKNAPSRATTLMKEGDTILSTTRPYLGAFAIVPKEYDGFVCSSGFALADEILVEGLLKEYVLIFLKSSFGLKQMERYMSGGSYPAIVQSELIKVKVPKPSVDIQQLIIRENKEISSRLEKEEKDLSKKLKSLNKEIEHIFLGTQQLAS